MGNRSVNIIAFDGMAYLTKSVFCIIQFNLLIDNGDMLFAIAIGGFESEQIN